MTFGDRYRALRELAVRRYGRVLLSIVVFGALLRIGVYFDLRASDETFFYPSLDSTEFLRWAREIAGGDLLGDRPFFLNPLYPYFIAPIVAIAGGAELILIRLVQAGLGLATILLVAGSTRRLLGPGTALLAALLAATYPLLLYYEQKVMIVTLAVFLNALALYALARLMDRPTALRALLAGLPLGLSVLARPNVILFAMMLPLWFLTLAPERKLRFAITRTALLMVGVFAMILPVTWRNHAVGDDLVVVTSSMGINLWQSNNPQAQKTGWMASKEVRSNPVMIENDSILVAERETGRKLRPSEVSGYWSRRTLDHMRDEPGISARFLLNKLFLFFRGFEIPSSYVFDHEIGQTRLVRHIPLSFAVLSPLMALGMILVTVRRRRALPLVFLVLSYAVGLTIFYPLGHYRAPILPAAVALAAAAVTVLAEWAASGRWRGFAICAVLLLVLAAATQTQVASGLLGFRKTSRQGTLEMLHYNRGMHLLKQGRTLDAEAEFRRGLKVNPRVQFPHLGLAAVAHARGELATEAVHLRRALKWVPRDGDTVARLAWNQFSRGERERLAGRLVPAAELQGRGLALALLAVELAPNSELTHVILADIHLSRAQWQEAFEELGIAIRSAHYPRPEYLADRALCLRKLDRETDAFAEIERGLRLEPRNPVLLRAWVQALIESGTASKEEIRAAVDALTASGGEVPEEAKALLE